MKVLIVRHAIAENRDVFSKTGKSDDLRPLTPRGRKRMRANLNGIINLTPQIDILVSSPLIRAVQTAEIMREHYKKADYKMIKELEPTAPLESAIQWLKKHKNKKVIALIGHEPHLGELISYFLTGKGSGFFFLRKGGICLVEFFGKIDSGRANLNCFLQPAQLRKIGKGT
jgi:phosphohistidine phosphatase